MCEYVNVCPCMCCASWMPGKPFTKVLTVVRFQATFILFFCIFHIVWIFCTCICYFTIKKPNMVALRKKERGRKGGRERRKRERKKEREKERKKKNEERKQRLCEVDSLLKDGCNLDQPSEFTHLGSETWQERRQSPKTLFFAMVRLPSFLITWRAESACQGWICTLKDHPLYLLLSYVLHPVCHQVPLPLPLK